MTRCSRRSLPARLLLLSAAGIIACGCKGESGGQKAEQAFNETDAAPRLPAGHPDISSSAPPPNAVAGVEWTVPARWQIAGQRPMRAATYSVPAAAGDPEAGECAVFYFGIDQGGDVDANVERWIGQFDQPDGSPSSARAKTGRFEADGLAVTTVEVGGTYTAAMGPGSPKSNKENFHLLGAIVEGPEGAVFFKFTGPATTVRGARADFEQLIRSVRKLRS